MIYLSISFIFPLTIETDLSFGEFWTGLKNPNHTICQDGDCINKLTWDSDGSTLDTWVDPNHRIIMKTGSECIPYTN